MAQEMNKYIRSEHLLIIRKKYQRANKTERSRILDDFIEDSSMNRKSAIRLLNQKAKSQNNHKKAGRKKEYDDPVLIDYIKKISAMTNHICSKRLKPALIKFIPFYEKRYGVFPEQIKKLIRQISARTIDRIFSEHMPQRIKKGLCTTKPGSLIRKKIPIKTNQWDEKRAGYFEVDTVAHCGGSTLGMYVNTLNFVDIATSWTVSRAVWGKGQNGVFEAIKDVMATLPFRIRGFDSDNGGEFMNERLYSFLKKQKRKIEQTRSREYKKNDNAHIESKNWSVIRQYFGYERFDDSKITEILNDLYKNDLYYYINFFISSAKLIDKKRIGSKTIKKHDDCKTPFERLLKLPDVPSKIKKELSKLEQSLDPITLYENIRRKIKIVNSLATPYVSLSKDR
jgi:hypothetical protein